MVRKLRAIFNKKSFDRTFIRQRDDFSCAAASCATVARLYGLDPAMDISFFRKALKLTMNGASEKNIEDVCKTHLPVEKAGRNVYHGGVAIGFIRHKPDGDDHAVVFLARKDDTVIYYDPYDHRIFRDRVSNMRRSQHPGDPHRTWTANFPAISGAGFDFWTRHAEPSPYRLREQAFWLREHDKKPSL